MKVIYIYGNQGRRWLSHFRLILLFYLLHSSIYTFSQPLHLFNKEIREAAGRQVLIMDFVERYFNAYFSGDKEFRDLKMADDRVFFREGHPKDLYQLSDTVPCSITFHGNYYEVNWLQNEKPIVCIVFPAQYDLILGQSKFELIKKMPEFIDASPQREVKTNIPKDNSLKHYKDKIYICQHDFMDIKSLTDATYYRCEKASEPSPLFENKYLEESAANLFQGIIKNKDYRFHIQQAVDYDTPQGFLTTLNQWLNYCVEQKLKIYFATEEVRGDGILALVMAHSDELNYNHMLSVVIPDNFVDNNNVVLKAKLTAFIPTHNLKKDSDNNH